MKNRNYQVRGFLFVAACITLALLAHLLLSQGIVSRSGSDEPVVAAADNLATSMDVPTEDKAVQPARPSEQISDHRNASNGCYATVLHAVEALGDPSVVLEPGERWGDITQLVKNDQTGATWYCHYGDRCFPTESYEDGQHIPAFSMMDCAYAPDQPQRDGEITMYPVERIQR